MFFLNVASDAALGLDLLDVSSTEGDVNSTPQAN
jgi:hypothetical protein